MTQISALIVEDEATIAELVATMLETQGIAATISPSVADAMHRIETTAYTLALVDLTLPDGEPDAFIQATRARGSQVIAMSGDPDRLASYAPLPLLEKPFRMKALLEQVRQAVPVPN
ncbi:response regulator receiver protein [Gluconacetobacter sp. SXCC-1]|uniref:response regulator n=1 Tax=Komagataeibacter rhaeticus TaxID=215221 RepID=UPI000208011D|nr:response regulator [Komagataeibacter rhaeticus]ATU72363.1 response regulator [Komagataeibacter xylinus]EGG74974.1 response regulator receiver protein [Gluconacetobacter sp. SXCC-1]WPP22096.1 response regulator [Komagataeibacter rhaeticus]